MWNHGPDDSTSKAAILHIGEGQEKAPPVWRELGGKVVDVWLLRSAEGGRSVVVMLFKTAEVRVYSSAEDVVPSSGECRYVRTRGVLPVGSEVHRFCFDHGVLVVTNESHHMAVVDVLSCQRVGFEFPDKEDVKIEDVKVVVLGDTKRVATFGVVCARRDEGNGMTILTRTKLQRRVSEGSRTGSELVRVVDSTTEAMENFGERVRLLNMGTIHGKRSLAVLAARTQGGRGRDGSGCSWDLTLMSMSDDDMVLRTRCGVGGAGRPDAVQELPGQGWVMLVANDERAEYDVVKVRMAGTRLVNQRGTTTIATGDSVEGAPPRLFVIDPDTFLLADHAKTTRFCMWRDSSEQSYGHFMHDDGVPDGCQGFVWCSRVEDPQSGEVRAVCRVADVGGVWVCAGTRGSEDEDEAPSPVRRAKRKSDDGQLGVAIPSPKVTRVACDVH